MSNEAPDERVVVDAESTEAYIERRRFQDLFDARQGVVERLRGRPQARLDGASPEDLDADFHAAVKAYITEAKWLFDKSEFGKRLWDHRKLGPVPIEAALPLTGITDLNQSSLPDPVICKDEHFALEGIKAYMALSGTHVEVAYEEEAPGLTSATHTITERVDFTPPRELSESAFSATDELLAEMGVLGELGADDWESDEPGA